MRKHLLLGLVLISLTDFEEMFAQETLPALALNLREANVRTRGGRLYVSSGTVERVWELTGSGLRTVGLKNLESGREWCTAENPYESDWRQAGLIDDGVTAKLESLKATVATDEGFTSEHIKVTAEFRYGTKVGVRYHIWAFPKVAGLRTQIEVRAYQGMDLKLAKMTPPRAEFIPLDWTGIARRPVGYYSDTQHRNAANLNILKEKLVSATVLQPERYDWASVLFAEDAKGGLAMVKESHKCVNQAGIGTGSFTVDTKGLGATGWGIDVTDLNNSWRKAWANWCLVYTGGDFERQASIKAFDRARYPIDEDLDVYILANTWGTGNAMEASREENILKEIKVQSELGIDAQQIDDGWQNPGNVRTMSTVEWKPDPTRYPEGWKNVKQQAKEKGLDLGIWFSLGSLNDEHIDLYGDNWAADLNDLKTAFDYGGFTYYKFDMVNLRDYDELEDLMATTRDFVKYTNQKVRVNWDVTEIEPRMGYFFGREYGNIYLANRKTQRAKEIVYVPYLMLRDAWEVSKYLNLNKFQVSVQNIDLTDRSVSNAHLYNHPYSVAITLMGSPLFFQETQYYSDSAREEIKTLLSVYKEHRSRMYGGYVFPIGEEPSDRGWTGFQNWVDDTSGYLMVFRELNNPDKRYSIKLEGISGKKLRLKDLRNGRTNTVSINKEGKIELRIDKPADFLFITYEIL